MSHITHESAGSYKIQDCLCGRLGRFGRLGLPEGLLEARLPALPFCGYCDPVSLRALSSSASACSFSYASRILSRGCPLTTTSVISRSDPVMDDFKSFCDTDNYES